MQILVFQPRYINQILEYSDLTDQILEYNDSVVTTF